MKLLKRAIVLPLIPCLALIRVERVDISGVTVAPISFFSFQEEALQLPLAASDIQRGPGGLPLRSAASKAFHRWAAEHAGTAVQRSHSSIASEFRLPRPYVTTHLHHTYKISTIGKSGPRKESTKRLATFADSISGTVVSRSQMAVAAAFGVSQERVSAAFQARDISTSNSAQAALTERGARLLAFLESHRGQFVPVTRMQLAQRFGMQYEYVCARAKPYEIRFLDEEEVSDPQIPAYQKLLRREIPYGYNNQNAEDALQERYLIALQQNPNATFEELSEVIARRGLFRRLSVYGFQKKNVSIDSDMRSWQQLNLLGAAYIPKGGSFIEATPGVVSLIGKLESILPIFQGAFVAAGIPLSFALEELRTSLIYPPSAEHSLNLPYDESLDKQDPALESAANLCISMIQTAANILTRQVIESLSTTGTKKTLYRPGKKTKKKSDAIRRYA